MRKTDLEKRVRELELENGTLRAVNGWHRKRMGWDVEIAFPSGLSTETIGEWLDCSTKYLRDDVPSISAEEASAVFGDMPDITNPKDAFGALKAPLDLVPPALLITAAAAMANGAEKYGPYNWREKHVKASIYYAAALRHFLAWFDGEDDAADSGTSHLGHVAACCGILLDAYFGKYLIDDRPATGPGAQMLADHDQTRAGTRG